jgi:selenide, water dikinase
MKKLPVSYTAEVLAGFQGGEDAGVYKISDDTALVQTVDFFTPIVDDPFDFGRVAAANSLSDIYAMGGVPLTAMNIVAFPINTFSLDVLTEVLKGGLKIMEEAGVQLLGGHSVEDEEFKYGLSVTGTIHPDKIIRNRGLMPGDCLILTKGLGTGIIGTAVKAGLADKAVISGFTESMTTLNKGAAEVIRDYPVHSCTDITGFGLAGHLKEMVGNDKLEVIINSQSLRILEGAKDLAETGIIPAGLYRNRDYTEKLCVVGKGVEQYLSDILFDPQTSGGLLFSLDKKLGDEILPGLLGKGLKDSAIIGEVRESDSSRITIV